jgi:hypothetical protein
MRQMPPSAIVKQTSSERAADGLQRSAATRSRPRRGSPGAPWRRRRWIGRWCKARHVGWLHAWPPLSAVPRPWRLRAGRRRGRHRARARCVRVRALEPPWPPAYVRNRVRALPLLRRPRVRRGRRSHRASRIAASAYSLKTKPVRWFD